MSASVVDVLQALLFVAPGPVSLADLAAASGMTEGQAEQGLEVLSSRLASEGALCVVNLAGGYQLSTKAEFAETVAAFLRPERQKLGRSQLEVLAIIAYRQPITAGEIEQLRGVQSDYSIRALLDKRLIREAGRKKAPGRPHLYATTDQFLHDFNLASLENLPPVERLGKLTSLDQGLFGSVESGVPE